MTRYFMTPKKYNRFRTLKYNLVCKICECPILPTDEVESKASGSGPKFYHADCYDRFHLDFDEEGVIKDGKGDVIGETGRDKVLSKDS